MSDSMRYEANLEQPIHGEDFEEHEEEWQQVGRIRFSMKASQGTDPDSDDQIDHVRKYAIRTRYRKDLTKNMRLNMQGRLLYIDGIPIDATQREKWLEFNAEELVV